MNNLENLSKKVSVLERMISPGVAIIISFLLGYSVLFMPWTYITIQPLSPSDQNLDRTLFVRGRDFPSVDNCFLTKVEWTPSYLQRLFQIRGLLENLLLSVPIYIWLYYLGKNVKVTTVSFIVFFFVSLLLLVAPIFVLREFDVPRVACDPAPVIRVTAISVFLPTPLMWLLSTGFGILALQHPASRS